MSDTAHPNLLILDACVLIDYWKTESKILAEFGKHIGKLHIADPVLKEVEDINDSEELLNLGVRIVQPEVNDIIEAGSKRSQLSFQDRLCLIIAKRKDFICVTNDKTLRRFCEIEGINIMWGLEMLLLLHEKNVISYSHAAKIAKKIQNINPKHVNDKVIQKFITKLKGIKLK